MDVPGVVVGKQIVLPADGGTYALYLLFPMSEEKDTLGLLQNSHKVRIATEQRVLRGRLTRQQLGWSGCLGQGAPPCV